MALRPSKISSEIIQTCNRFLSSSTDASLKSKVPLAVASSQKDGKNAPYRYKITNVGKPQGMPELSFQDEPTTLFAELQPSAKPEFRFDFNPPKWAEKSTDNSPFPASIKAQSRLHVTYTDQQKADDKMMKYKMACFQNSHRHYSTSCARRYSSGIKGPADNSGSGTCKPKAKKCYQAKFKDCKVPSKTCPRFKLCDCEQSKGSNCNLNYLDPNCVKKFAPYPSYSESCAENLPDDPSECQQCPWRTCDGADTIEPGKPVRNKRNYSTYCSRHLDATAGVVVGPLAPPLSPTQVQEYLVTSDRCGQIKPPCKEPIGPCEARRQKEEEKKREKAIKIPPKPKKASPVRMVLAGIEGQTTGNDFLMLDPFRGNAVGIDLDQQVENKNSWIEVNNDPEEMLMTTGEKRRKYPDCRKKHKPKRPDEGKMSEDMGIEYGNAEWWKGLGKKTVVYNKDEDDKRFKCPCTDCPDVTIRSKQGLASTLEMSLSNKGGKRIKGDEGSPPPCDHPVQDSQNCPEKPLKKPKYGKRPMRHGYYRRPEDPYNSSNGK